MKVRRDEEGRRGSAIKSCTDRKMINNKGEML